MTRSELFTAAHSMTRTLVGPGISYRATFGLVLRHLREEAEIMTTPATRSFEIAEILDVKRRKTDGSVSYLKARVRVGDRVVFYQSSGQMTDGDEHVLVVEGDRLIVAGKHLERLESEIAAAEGHAARQAQLEADLAAVDAPAIALLPTLPPIEGVSEAQVAYATRVRERKFVYMMRACDSTIAQDPASAPQVEAARARFLKNAKAKFWLDTVEDTDGGLYPQTVIARIAQKMLKAGYVIPARADAGV